MILEDIVEARRRDLERAKKAVSLAELEKSALYAERRRGFAASLAAGGRAIIAEVKKASPSRGVIREDFDPVALARRYAECGAAAVSVLTEERHFQGSLQYLADIRRAVDLPLLRKDFLVDAYQIIEARAWGADAVLLIVAILGDRELADLLAAARDTGLDALVEAHTAEEVDRALGAGARIVGVNNRDLRTFVTSLSTAEGLRPRIPAGVIAVAESGIDTPADIARLEAAGFHVFLVGEALMRAPDPGAKLALLLGTDRGGRAEW
jgi:indole-3-glycerol phosphate synthase